MIKNQSAEYFFRHFGFTGINQNNKVFLFHLTTEGNTILFFGDRILRNRLFFQPFLSFLNYFPILIFWNPFHPHWVIIINMIFHPKIKAVIFDLGDTLMLPSGSWESVFLHASSALQNYLCENNIIPPSLNFRSIFLESLNEYYQIREKTLRETTTSALLRELLSKYQIRPTDDIELNEALDTFYQVTRSNWHIDPQSPVTLRKLREDGLQIGMISNAGNEADVIKLLENFAILPYFSFVITSAGVGYRKPHSNIFSHIFDHWTYAPNEMMMVGDRLDTDVLGARDFGLHTVWLNRKGKKNTIPALKPDIETRELHTFHQFL